MRALHMSEADFLRDIQAVLKKVDEGEEIVIERDSLPIAVIKPPQTKGRMISEVIADLKQRRSGAVIDEDFARDVQAGVDLYREPWNPPSWD
jgi:antitoxin (DNA-binding transcriptional repressor) of toxin-antitoxin stability system